MKIRSLYILLFTLITIWNVSCTSKEPNYHQYLPTDFDVAVCINTSSIKKKISVEILNDFSLLNEFSANSGNFGFISNLLTDAKDHGLILDKKIFAAYQKTDTLSTWKFLIPIDNPKKLKGFLDNQKLVTNQHKGYQQAIINDSSLIAWNEDICILHMQNKKTNKNTFFSIQETFLLNNTLLSSRPMLQAYFPIQKDLVIINKLPTVTGNSICISTGEFTQESINMETDIILDTILFKTPLLASQSGIKIDTSSTLSFSCAFSPKGLLPFFKNFSKDSLLNHTLENIHHQYHAAFTGEFHYILQEIKETTKEIITYDYDDDFNKIEVKSLQKDYTPVYQVVLNIKDSIQASSLLKSLGQMGTLIKQHNNYVSVFGKDTTIVELTNKELLIYNTSFQKNIKSNIQSNFMVNLYRFHGWNFVHSDWLKDKNKIFYISTLFIHSLQSAIETKDNKIKIHSSIKPLQKNKHSILIVLDILQKIQEATIDNTAS